jgi:O-antigen biosynthesis protein
MNILIIADFYPMPDRNSADFRFSNLIAMMREQNKISFCAIGEQRQVEEIGQEQTDKYCDIMVKSGVNVLKCGINRALREKKYDAVIFEWYFAALHLLEAARFQQPQARIIIDSVDVAYNRFEAKARLTNNLEDITQAKKVKQLELSVYENSDLVITVTDADAAILHNENPSISSFTIPNIHPLENPVNIPLEPSKQMVFVGKLDNEPNIDAMIYFCHDVLPLIVKMEPNVKLLIIGSSPTQAIKDLSSGNVEVLGFVPETRPYLASSTISIAPLRFGGGMKGKIGEALSYALPVVTTTTGIEGFGLHPGVHLLVGDTPEEFADAVISLFRDRSYLEQIRMAGYQFIRDNYSDVAVKKRVNTLLTKLDTYPIHKQSLKSLWLNTLRQIWQQYVGWRLK